MCGWHRSDPGKALQCASQLGPVVWSAKNRSSEDFSDHPHHPLVAHSDAEGAYERTTATAVLFINSLQPLMFLAAGFSSVLYSSLRAGTWVG